MADSSSATGSSSLPALAAAAVIVAVIAVIAVVWSRGRDRAASGGRAAGGGRAANRKHAAGSNFALAGTHCAGVSCLSAPEIADACGEAAGAAGENAARAAADRAAPFDGEALVDMSPARAGAGGLNAGDAAAVTGRVYETGARLFGPGGLWTNPANRPRVRPLPWSLGPLTGPLTASDAGVPAAFAVDSTPLPPDSSCGYVDLPPATTGGASGVVLLDKTTANFPRWGSAPNAPPYTEGFGAKPRAGDPPAARCRDAAGKAALGIAPSGLAAPPRCDDYWSWEQGAPALGTQAGGAPVQLAVPDADELSGWAENGSGSVPMQWRPSAPSI